MVDGALVHPEREPVRGPALWREVHDVREERAAVRMEVGRLWREAELADEHRARAAGVGDEPGADLARVGLHDRVVGREPDGLDARPLPDVSAVADGGVDEGGVGVLAVEVELVAVGLARNDGLERLVGVGRIVVTVGAVVEEPEVPLDAVRRARERGVGLGREVGELGHVVERGERAERLAGLQDHRLADGEPGMRGRLQHDHVEPLPRQDGGEGGPGEPGPDDGDVVVWLHVGKGVAAGQDDVRRARSQPY